MSTPESASLGRSAALAALVALAVLHQDLWLWEDATLLGGVVPVGLAYHVGYSVACALTWAAVTRFAWPVDDAEGGA